MNFGLSFRHFKTYTSMNDRIRQDLQETPGLLSAAKDFSEQFLSTIEALPAGRGMQAFEQLSLPEGAQGAAHAMHQFETLYAPYVNSSAGPRYWGFVTGGTTPAALVGDWLTAVMDLNAADRTAVSFHMEGETLHMLRQLFGLPDEYLGCFVSGATMSNFSGLATGRQWLGMQRGINIGEEGLHALGAIRLVAAMPHSSVVKSMAMMGLGRSALVRIPALPGREAIDVAQLEQYLAAHPEELVIVSASAGTVNTVDFDDIAAIVKLKKRYAFWLHVDAAFGGFAALSDTHRHLLAGWEQADSITIDAHKWLNVPYDSAMLFTRHPEMQLEVFKNAGAAYLGDPAKQFNYTNYGPENSRRFRALPAWFSLQAYGREGYSELVTRNIRHAHLLGQHIASDERFRLLAPVHMCVTCFTLNIAEAELPEAIAAYLQALQDSGVVYMTATHYAGVPAIRAALVNWRTTEEDVIVVWEEMQRQVAALLARV